MNLITIGSSQPGSTTLPLFIIIAALWSTVFLVSLKTYGWKPTFRYFVPMLIASAFLEGSAVATGRYTYPGYTIYLTILGGAIPFIILVGWSLNLFLFLQLATRLTRSITTIVTIPSMILTAALTGLIGIAVDLFEDPLAHHAHWWIWTEATTASTFFGVPILNYFDWFLILFFMSLATLLIEHAPVSENRKVLLSFFSIPLLGGLIYLSHSLLVMIL